MPDDPTLPEDKPPYLSLTTLTNFFERWGDGPIPPRIDRSALDNYSGGTQALLMTTLRQIGYVNGDGYVLPALREAVSNPVTRKVHLEQWARRFYAKQLRLAEQNATSQMLHESFATYGYNGSTLRKAVVFYLALVEYLGLPNSPHFRAPKQAATPTSRRRKAVPASRPESNLPPVYSPPPTEPKGEQTIVRIGSLATITVNVEAQWMKLPVETITAMREAIAKLEALGDGEAERP